jgi:hypothetical protein
MSYWHGRTIKPGDKVINRKTGSYGIASVNSKGAYVAVTGGAPGNLKDWTKK